MVCSLITCAQNVLCFMGLLNICVWVEHYSVTFMMADTCMLHVAIKIEWHDNIIATTGACKYSILSVINFCAQVFGSTLRRLLMVLLHVPHFLLWYMHVCLLATLLLIGSALLLEYIRHTIEKVPLARNYTHGWPGHVHACTCTCICKTFKYVIYSKANNLVKFPTHNDWSTVVRNPWCSCLNAVIKPKLSIQS